jgi:hypothetical protein
MLIIQRNAGKISWKKDISSAQRRNVYAMVMEVGLYCASIVAANMLGGDDEDDLFVTKRKKMMLQAFQQLTGGVLFMFYGKGWKDLEGSTIPFLDIGLNLYNLALHLSKWERYENETKYSEAGRLKWLIDLTYVLPFGSGVRWGIGVGRRYKAKRSFYNLLEFNVNDADLEEAMIPGNMLSQYQMEEYASKYDQLKSAIIQAAEMKQKLEDAGGDRTRLYTMYDVNNGIEIINSETTKLTKAINYVAIERKLRDGGLEEYGLDIDTINELYKLYNDISDERSIMPDKVKIRRFQKAVGELSPDQMEMLDKILKPEFRAFVKNTDKKIRLKRKVEKE